MLCKKTEIIFFVRNWFPFWLRGCWLGELVGCGCAISSSFYPQAADKLDSLHFINFQLWTSNIIHRPKHYRSFNLDHKLIFNLCVLRIIIEIVISRLKPIYLYKFREQLPWQMDATPSRASLARDAKIGPGGVVLVYNLGVAWKWLGGLEVAGNREQLLGKQLELAACSLLGDQPLNE